MAHPVVQWRAEDDDIRSPRGERGDIGQQRKLLERCAAEVGRQVEVVPFVQHVRAVGWGRVVLAPTGRGIGHASA